MRLGAGTAGGIAASVLNLLWFQALLAGADRHRFGAHLATNVMAGQV